MFQVIREQFVPSSRSLHQDKATGIMEHGSHEDKIIYIQIINKNTCAGT